MRFFYNLPILPQVCYIDQICSKVFHFCALAQGKWARSRVVTIAEAMSGSEVTEPYHRLPQAKYKTKLCTRWEDTGRCYLESKCTFFHRGIDDRPAASGGAYSSGGTQQGGYRTTVCKSLKHVERSVGCWISINS